MIENIFIFKAVEQTLGKHNRKPFLKFVTDENKHLATVEALDLLSKMLLFDHVIPLIIFFARIYGSLPKKRCNTPTFH
jgi:casein kinase II subunit alpha